MRRTFLDEGSGHVGGSWGAASPPRPRAGRELVNKAALETGGPCHSLGERTAGDESSAVPATRAARFDWSKAARRATAAAYTRLAEATYDGMRSTNAPVFRMHNITCRGRANAAALAQAARRRPPLHARRMPHHLAARACRARQGADLACIGPDGR